jgi:hypothetical protein
MQDASLCALADPPEGISNDQEGHILGIGIGQDSIALHLDHVAISHNDGLAV